jgi:DNA-binding transcriptional LysR family regulator
MVDLNRLQLLRVLADRGTVTATAEALYITPSAVSQQLRQLANELGFELLRREGRGVRLTPTAEALLEHADAMHENWERAIADVRARMERITGTVRVCGVSSAVSSVIAPAVAIMRQRCPGLNPHIMEVDSDECFPLLLAEVADIAIALPTEGTPPLDDSRFEQVMHHEDVQDLLVQAEHSLAERDEVRLVDAATESWIVKPGTDTCDLLLATCTSAGFTPRITHHAEEWFAVSALVGAGLGVCLLPRLVPIPDEHTVVRLPLSGNPRPTRRLITGIRRGSAENPAIAQGLAALEAVMADIPRPCDGTRLGNQVMPGQDCP